MARRTEAMLVVGLCFTVMYFMVAGIVTSVHHGDVVHQRNERAVQREIALQHRVDLQNIHDQNLSLCYRLRLLYLSAPKPAPTTTLPDCKAGS